MNSQNCGSLTEGHEYKGCENGEYCDLTSGRCTTHAMATVNGYKIFGSENAVKEFVNKLKALSKVNDHNNTALTEKDYKKLLVPDLRNLAEENKINHKGMLRADIIKALIKADVSPDHSVKRNSSPPKAVSNHKVNDSEYESDEDSEYESDEDSDDADVEDLNEELKLLKEEAKQNIEHFVSKKSKHNKSPKRVSKSNKLYTEGELSKMTVANLKELAKKLPDNMPSKISRKADIVKYLLDKEVSKGEVVEEEEKVPAKSNYKKYKLYSKQELEGMTTQEMVLAALDNGIKLPFNTNRNEIMDILIKSKIRHIGESQYSNHRKESADMTGKKVYKFTEKDLRDMTCKELYKLTEKDLYEMNMPRLKILAKHDRISRSIYPGHKKTKKILVESLMKSINCAKKTALEHPDWEDYQ